MGLLIHNKCIFSQVSNSVIEREYLLKGDVSDKIYSFIEDESRDESVEKKWGYILR